MKGRRGAAFTITEVLIAIGVTSVALLGILSAIAFGLFSTNHAGRTTQANNLARHTLELIRTRNLPFTFATIPPGNGDGLNDTNTQRRAMTDPPFVPADFADSGGKVFPDLQTYQRNIQMEPVKPGTYTNNGSATLMRIKISIFWTERTVERSVTIYGYHRRP